MKHNRLFLLMAAAGAVAAAGNAGATSDTSGTGQAQSGAAPDSNVAEATKPKRAAKNPDNKLDIINGRIPLPLVFVLRFKDNTSPVAEAAKKYGTSVGKVFDIRKNKNFAYVDASYKPSAEEVAAANAWCETAKTFKGKTLKEAGGDPDGIKSAISALGVATPDEVAKRGWATRTVGQKKEPAAGAQAPVASGDAGKGAAAAPAGDGKGAKLF